ncbi:hypothetical protein MATL_G00148280 [Megalops atlanticus]|uniref:Rootletin-like coiled-coil domain-containing protein n=1 Tax=Megalops atlanticus TaxID=7932 RepID=A0A9D3T217_MEGAT|nr:hypothetical protein MATL_G00148280 [Megalops atlanticus]
MESELLIGWQDERAELRAELSRLQDELAESCAEREELRSRAQALTDRLAQSLDPSLSLRLDAGEQRDWRRKLREGREREARQAQLIHKLQSKVLEYRERCQGLEQQLISEERELQKREKRIREQHSNSLESALIRLEEEQQRSVGMTELNALLRSQLKQSGEANEALREDLGKLTADWARAVEEAGQRENEWQKEKELLTSHIGREHTRLMSLWGGVVTLRRQYHTMRTATDRDLWELRAEFSRLSSTLLSSCSSFGSAHTSGIGTSHAPDLAASSSVSSHPHSPTPGPLSLRDLERDLREKEREFVELKVQHNAENQELLNRISELSVSLQAQERERKRHEEEREREREREVEKEREREKDWERHRETERDLQSVRQALVNLSSALSESQCVVQARVLSSHRLDGRTSSPLSVADLSSDGLASLLTIIAQAETALQCRHEELQEALVRMERMEEEREALEQQIRVLEKDGAELQEWALQGRQELRHAQEMLQSEKEMVVSLTTQLDEAEQLGEELRKESERLRRQREWEAEERRELERERQRRLQAELEESVHLSEREARSRQELHSLRGALEREQLERERAEEEAADAKDALLKARESVLALSSSQTQLRRELAERQDSLEKMAALNEALAADKRELNTRTLQLETELAGALSRLQAMGSEVTTLHRELKMASQEVTELRAQRSAELDSLQKLNDREKDLERELETLKKESERKISQLLAEREKDAQRLEERSGLHSAVCGELRGAQAELCRAVEQQKRAERERDDLLREGERLEGGVRALEREREELQRDRNELRTLTASLQQQLSQQQEQGSGLEVHRSQLEVQVHTLQQAKDVLQGEIHCLREELERQTAQREVEREEERQERERRLREAEGSRAEAERLRAELGQAVEEAGRGRRRGMAGRGRGRR